MRDWRWHLHRHRYVYGGKPTNVQETSQAHVPQRSYYL